MFGQFAVGSALIVLSIAVHAGFMALAARAVRRREAWLRRPPALARLGLALALLSLWLMAGMSATVWIWALYFLWSGALGDLEEAVYFSLISFTTLGFGDIVLDRPHRLLSGMLAANGLVLFGLTTAVLIDLIRSLHSAQAGPRSGG
ncbi:MAG: potassium channel family protein [Defluviicoccus sp.]|nr:potassium channel family protein [Defluviicoccus sp.]MDE0386990.1 potassium channel family protein [Defluviicoccus sp.]